MGGAVVSALGFLPLCRLGGELLPAVPWLPPLFSTEIAFWALCSAAIVLVAAHLAGALGGAAAAVLALGYALVAVVQSLFDLEFRIWFTAFKPMSRWQAGAFPVYLLVFALYFAISLRALQALITRRCRARSASIWPPSLRWSGASSPS